MNINWTSYSDLQIAFPAMMANFFVNFFADAKCSFTQLAHLWP